MVAILVGLVGCGGGDEAKPSDDTTGDDGTGTTEGTTDSGDTGTTEPPFDVAAELERLLIGHYDSLEQSETDSDYYHITLDMCPVSVPELGERVLYVEQTAADTPGEPYRQRLYLIEATDTENRAVSRVFELGGPRSFIGACEDAEGFEIDMDRVLVLEGCDVFLDWDGSRFVGGTVEDNCGTDFGGATYATSEIELDEALLVSWDRGYNDAGRQVWGATGGGYQFIRRTELGSW
jgi:hypothetical protein